VQKDCISVIPEISKITWLAVIFMAIKSYERGMFLNVMV
jgi:hypothetical protein